MTVYNQSERELRVHAGPLWLAVPPRSVVGDLVGGEMTFHGTVQVFDEQCLLLGEQNVVARDDFNVVVNETGGLVGAGEDQAPLRGLRARDPQTDDLYLFPGDERRCAS